MSEDKIAIYLITRNRLLGEALTKIMREKAGFHVMGAAPFSAETTERVSSGQPDVLLLDATLDSSTGLEIIPEMRRCAPKAKIILIGMEHDKEVFLNAVHEGVV